MAQFPSVEASRFSASNQFPTFYGKWKFITAFTWDFSLSISWARSIQSIPPFHFTKIYLNIILSFTPGSLGNWAHGQQTSACQANSLRVTNSTDFFSSRSWGSSDDRGTKLLVGGNWNQISIPASVRHFPASEASRPVLRRSQSSNPEVLGTLCAGLNQLERIADCYISLRDAALN